MALLLSSWRLSLPAHWDCTLLHSLHRWCSEQENPPEITFYGSLAQVNSSGRMSSALARSSLESARKYVRTLHELGFSFRYVFNSPNVDLHFADKLSFVIDTLSIADASGIARLTVTRKEHLRLARSLRSPVDVSVSTIAAVADPEGILEFSRLGANRICLHHDVNRNFSLLASCVQTARDAGVTLELLANENCVPRCAIRQQHYAMLSSQSSIDTFQVPCWIEKLERPELLLGASWITPEGIAFYRALGITDFKLSGRDKPASWLPVVMKSYLEGAYAGNLCRLLGTTPQPIIGYADIVADDLLFLSTSALRNFYHNLQSTSNSQDYYCRITRQLFEQQDLRFSPFAGEYAIKDGLVRLATQGPYLKAMQFFAKETEALQLWRGNPPGQ